MSISKRKSWFGRLAWVLAGLVVVVALGQLPLTVQQNPPVSLGAWASDLAWGVAIPSLYAVLAALIINRQPGNRVGWLMLLVGLAAIIPTATILGTIPEPSIFTPGIWLLAAVDNWSWVPLIFAIFLIPLHFPTGRPPTPRWRWVNWLAVGMAVFFIALISLVTPLGPFDESWMLPNPVGFIPLEWVNGPFLIVWGIGLVTVVGASVVSLFVRFRRGSAVEREQIKWLLYAGAFLVVAYALTFYLTSPDATSDAWGNLLLTVAILALPVAIAIAILRYRLYDIDVIIRKTLVYAALTVLLALVYFGSVILLQRVLGTLTGIERSPLAVVVSTLIIAALFTPLRRRIQDWIDRRFFRKKYDAQQVLAQFALTARDETDLDALTAELVRVVQETMQPEQVSVWLRDMNSPRV